MVSTINKQLKKKIIIINFRFRLLDLACHDQNHGVQVSAIMALRSLSKLEELKKVILKHMNVSIKLLLYQNMDNFQFSFANPNRLDVIH